MGQHDGNNLKAAAEETMSFSRYEPSETEILITLGLGLSVISPYYRRFVRGLRLRGDERVLDYGSGSGVCSRHLAARLRRGGGHLDCVDISRGWMQVVRRTLRACRHVDFHLGLIRDVLIADGSVDAVVVHFVLHDIPAVERPLVMNCLSRKLSPGGRLLLREPTGEGLEREELYRLANNAGLASISLQERKCLAGVVYDAEWTRPKP
ncbi:MAG: class I SAM-dependent methyltransferase [Anaerolineae bacterium]|nr:class I SAM-dependent methyltransferase [Anaerolineae bacterium]